MGDSRKYPYPTTGGMRILAPPCPPNSKITNPPSPPEFSTFVSDPLKFLFVYIKPQTNEKLALFPSAMKN